LRIPAAGTCPENPADQPENGRRKEFIPLISLNYSDSWRGTELARKETQNLR
jgi:hypothetical protein